MAEDVQTPEEVQNGMAEGPQGGESDDILETDIVFECPTCGETHVIDYKGMGTTVPCKGCGRDLLVPFPEGMGLTDLDMDIGEALKQLFVARRRCQKAERQVQALHERLAHLQEALGVMQEVVAEGLAQG